MRNEFGKLGGEPVGVPCHDFKVSFEGLLCWSMVHNRPKTQEASTRRRNLFWLVLMNRPERDSYFLQVIACKKVGNSDEIIARLWGMSAWSQLLSCAL